MWNLKCGAFYEALVRTFSFQQGALVRWSQIGHGSLLETAFGESVFAPAGTSQIHPISRTGFPIGSVCCLKHTHLLAFLRSRRLISVLSHSTLEFSTDKKQTNKKKTYKNIKSFGFVSSDQKRVGCGSLVRLSSGVETATFPSHPIKSPR